MLQPQQPIEVALEGSPGGITNHSFLGSEPGPQITGTRTSPERAGTNQRKQRLLALIDELSALREDELEKGRDISYGLARDERVSSDNKGIERFQTFDKRIRILDLKLQSFANAVRQFGSSVGLLNATYHLRARLGQIQYFFRENAAELFDVIPHAPNVGTRPYRTREQGKSRRYMAAGFENNILWSTEIEDLPDEMESLAKELDAFLKRLNDVPEFADDAINASIVAFEGDLWYRASCLREFDGQLRSLAVARYINDLTEDLGAHIDSMKDSLDTFIDVGVPTIRFSQKHTTAGLQNLSSVATFFSGVTATTLQFSFRSHEDPLPDLVNALWISSLIFSIASAINSQLAYHWRAAMYRSPRCYVPWWVSIWITRTPLFFLVGSVIAFSIGLCVFTYSSGQSRAVSATVTAFTGLTSSALLCVGLWFASERWTFARTQGSRWLLDILEEHKAKIGKVTGITLIKKVVKRSVKRTRAFLKDVKHAIMNAFKHFSTKGIGRNFFSWAASPPILIEVLGADPPYDEESQGGTRRAKSPATIFNRGTGSNTLVANVHVQQENRELSDLHGAYEPIPQDEPLSLDTKPSSSPTVVLDPSNGITQTLGSSSSHSVEAGPSEQPQPHTKLKAPSKGVTHTAGLAPGAYAPSSLSDRHNSRDRQDSSEYELNQARVQTDVPTLHTLRSSQLLTEHVALVKHLQFSPDGQFLATCSWDRTALIWRVGSGPSDEFELIHKLVHTARVGGFIGQVTWGPNGEQLLTKQLKSIKVWNSKTGACKRTIDRKRSVQTITWMPNGLQILSIEWRMESSQSDKQVHHTENLLGSDLVILNTDGKQLQEHHISRLQIWDAAVVPDEKRLIAVATLLRSEQDLRPIKSRPEKRILIFNLQTGMIENQVPLLEEVRYIQLTEEGSHALVSYENNASPQVWRIDKPLGEGKHQLVLAHTYFTKHLVDFAGPSYFGGVRDTFVLAASKGGEIYIWERSSGVLLHSFKAPDQANDILLAYTRTPLMLHLQLTNLAWNYKPPNGFMLASAAHDGMVRIWTTAAAPPSRSHGSPPEPQEVVNPGFLPHPGSP